MTEQSRKPLYGTDLSQPLSKLIEGWRYQITEIRGQMGDFRFAKNGWREELETLEGGLTCMLMAMHNSMERAREAEQRANDEAA